MAESDIFTTAIKNYVKTTREIVKLLRALRGQDVEGEVFKKLMGFIQNEHIQSTILLNKESSKVKRIVEILQEKSYGLELSVMATLLCIRHGVIQLNSADNSEPERNLTSIMDTLKESINSGQVGKLLEHMGGKIIVETSGDDDEKKYSISGTYLTADTCALPFEMYGTTGILIRAEHLDNLGWMSESDVNNMTTMDYMISGILCDCIDKEKQLEWFQTL